MNAAGGNALIMQASRETCSNCGRSIQTNDMGIRVDRDCVSVSDPSQSDGASRTRGAGQQEYQEAVWVRDMRVVIAGMMITM